MTSRMVAGAVLGAALFFVGALQAQSDAAVGLHAVSVPLRHSKVWRFVILCGARREATRRSHRMHAVMLRR